MVASLSLLARSALVVREACGVYRPRHPERTAFYRLLEDHFEEFVLIHEERFEREDGPLRPVVPRVVTEFLDCGRPESGFARVRCPDCQAEYVAPWSCQTRNFCPSCQHKRAELLAEKLREEILAPVAHRHAIFTIPKVLRGLFLRERRLLGLLPRLAFETAKRCFAAVLGREDGVPGFVASIQTFGSQAVWNPHVHALLSDGLLLPGGGFLPLPAYDEEIERLLTETFRRLVLDALVKEERLAPSTRQSLLAWRHGGGFSVYARHLILNEEPARLAHMARYIVRPAVATDRVQATGDGKVLLEIPPDFRTGATVVALDPLEWVRRITNQVPDPRSHLVRYYGAYANRSRRHYRGDEAVATVRREDPESAQERPGGSWARLLRRALGVDPLVCPRCGAAMKVLSVISRPAVIHHILDHLQKTGAQDPFAPRGPPVPA